MAYFRKCRTCARNPDCEIKDRLRDAIKGLGITSLLHRCDSFEPRYAVGQQVTISTWVEGADEYGEPAAAAATFPGWFVSLAADGKGLVYVRPETPSLEDGRDKFDPRHDGFCKIPLSRIQSRPQDDPSPVCAKCSMVPNGECRNVDPDAYWEHREAARKDCPMLGSVEL